MRNRSENPDATIVAQRRILGIRAGKITIEAGKLPVIVYNGLPFSGRKSHIDLSYVGDSDRYSSVPNLRIEVGNNIGPDDHVQGYLKFPEQGTPIKISGRRVGVHVSYTTIPGSFKEAGSK